MADVEAAQKLRELADTQASLRRLAVLIASGAAPETVFAAVTEEALRHFGGGTARTIRYELDGSATLVANQGTIGPHVRVGERWLAGKQELRSFAPLGGRGRPPLRGHFRIPLLFFLNFISNSLRKTMSTQ